MSGMRTGLVLAQLEVQRARVRPRLELIKPAQVKPRISPDLLNQVDVRFGTILSVTDILNSEKLVALEVSFGDHKRTVLAGINSVPILAKSKASRLFSS